MLNLNQPDIKGKRERLRIAIDEDVALYEQLAPDAPGRVTIRNRLRLRLGLKAEFSAAARWYLMAHRDKAWVEALLR